MGFHALMSHLLALLEPWPESKKFLEINSLLFRQNPGRLP
jgi:hypothetical protein